MQGHESHEELLKIADPAIYQAKAAGRNTARFYDSVMQASAARIELAQATRLGLQLNKFILYYQIQVDGAGACVGVEALVRWCAGALVRWRNPQRGMVFPADFIPLAEGAKLFCRLVSGCWRPPVGSCNNGLKTQPPHAGTWR
jgi:predicted signal transduction protein with EAL and GGDEF domain